MFEKKPVEPWTDRTIMDFGRYENEKLGDVPASYLLWVYSIPSFKKSKPGLIAYIEKGLDHLKREAELE